jgi:hypothetical protein
MTGVRDALADYLQLRRRLGFEMPQDGRLLEGFVTFLEAAGAERISTDLALAWARSPGQPGPARLLPTGRYRRRRRCPGRPAARTDQPLTAATLRNAAARSPWRADSPGETHW